MPALRFELSREEPLLLSRGRFLLRQDSLPLLQSRQAPPPLLELARRRIEHLSQVAELGLITGQAGPGIVELLLEGCPRLTLFQLADPCRFLLGFQGDECSLHGVDVLLRRPLRLLGPIKLLLQLLTLMEFQKTLEFSRPFLVGAVALRLVRLSLERVSLPLDLVNDIVDPKQVLLCRLQLHQCRLLSHLICHEAGSLLNEEPALVSLRAHGVADGPLLDESVGLTPKPGIEEQIGDISKTARNMVKQVLALPGAIQSACDRHLVELCGNVDIIIGKGQGYVGHPEGFASTVSGENQVVHPVPSEQLRALFSQGPPDGVG